jgi:hypothetical protein
MRCWSVSWPWLWNQGHGVHCWCSNTVTLSSTMRTSGFELGSSALTSSTLKWLHCIKCGFKSTGLNWRRQHQDIFNAKLSDLTSIERPGPGGEKQVDLEPSSVTFWKPGQIAVRNMCRFLPNAPFGSSDASIVMTADDGFPNIAPPVIWSFNFTVKVSATSGILSSWMLIGRAFLVSPDFRVMSEAETE